MFALRSAFLALADGAVFPGISTSDEGFYCAEVVFNTAMFGYQEICTDPSYAGQIVVFTHPHVGNVGVNDEDNEADRSYVSGIVVKKLSKIVSNARATGSLDRFLEVQHIPCISGVDTRRLTMHIRETGAQSGCLAIGNISIQEAVQKAQEHAQAPYERMSEKVSAKQVYTWTKGICQMVPPAPVASVCVYDFGVKRSILCQLVQAGCCVTVVPSSFTAEQIFKLSPDGIVLSNGPGDPQKESFAKKTIRDLLKKNIPLLGICFGHQLLALAVGAHIVKMRLGHHGANHPVMDLVRQRAVITSQNHEFMVSEECVPDCIEVTHRSLIDGSIEGFRLKNLPVFGFQGHPEGGPGPSDSMNIFAQFVKTMGRHA